MDADGVQISEFQPLSEAKKRHLAVINLVFATVMLVGAWLVPMFTRDWHIKRWYGGLGVAGKVELSFGLLNFDVYATCNIFESFCTYLKVNGDYGVHSYFDLADRMCNIQQLFTHVVFRGCQPLHMLTLVSLATFVILCLSLWCFIMGMGLVLLYFNGYASKKLYHWIVGFYSTAPLLQFVAVTMYIGTTFDMRRFLDFGMIENFPGAKIVVGSSHVATFSFSTISCFCLCFISLVPLLILLQCIGRDKGVWKHAEEEALLAEWMMYEDQIQGVAANQPGLDGQGGVADGYAPDPYQQGRVAPDPYQQQGYAAPDPYQQQGYGAVQGYTPQY